MFELKINVGHCDLYFMVQWFCLISWRLFWCMNIFQDCESVWHNIWPQNKNRLLWPIFHGPVILPYILKTIWYMVGIINQYDLMFDLKINVDHYDLYFMVQWFCLIFWRLFDLWTSYFRIMSQYDTTFDLKINVGHFDLYLKFQWFCLISWKLFDIWTPYFGIVSRYDPMFDLKLNVGHCNIYFMVQWICLISWRLFHIWTPYFWIMSQYDPMFDLKKCRSLWPIFHGPVILPFILKTLQ